MTQYRILRLVLPIVLAAAAGGLLFGPPAIGQAREERDALLLRANRRVPPLPRKVLALYYPWYGLAAISGKDQHLEGVDPERKQIANFAHYPAAGPYDSTDERTLLRHLRELKQAGVDALACSWWGSGDFTDRAFRRLLPLARAQGLEACIYLETFQKAGGYPLTVEEMVPWIQAMARAPGYLKVAGKPVVFIYERPRRLILPEHWAETLVELERRVPPGIFAIVDSRDLVDALIFDGLHLNNPAPSLAAIRGPIQRGHHWSLLHSLTGLASRRHRLAVATVCPGFDDRKVAKPGLVVDRAEGRFYRDSWAAAIGVRPRADWVLIRSYNQWHDGTEIEPSVEFGDTYLKITAEEAARFKQAPVN